MKTLLGDVRTAYFGRIFSGLTVIRPYLIVAPDFGKHPFYGGNPESIDGGNVKRRVHRQEEACWSMEFTR